MNLRNAVGIVLLAGGAAASYWWSRPPPPESAVEARTGAELPGYYMKGSRFTVTDEAGRVVLRVAADSLDELPGDERYSLKGVRVEYTPADETPWSISASSATAPKDASQIDFAGEVATRSTPTDGSRPMQILSAEMQFWPHESQATTNGPVEMSVGDLNLTGVGLRAVLNAKKWELKSVHGSFSR